MRKPKYKKTAAPVQEKARMGMTVNKIRVHPAIAGWILGVVTSLPEMVTFFAIYSLAKKEGRSHLKEDTQEALDNLAASNMANTGLIYPLGLTVYLLGRGLTG